MRSLIAVSDAHLCILAVGTIQGLIPTGDAVVNLRENVIEYRIKYSASSLDDKNRQALLIKALRSVSQLMQSTVR